MKKVAFYLKNFNQGGIESTLLQYLLNLDPSLYKITLVIGFKPQGKNILLDRIPSHISQRFLFDKNLFQSSNGIANFINKFYYKLVLRPISKILHPIRLYFLLKQFDTVVDYGLTLGFIAKILSVRKITYFHFRISHHYIPNKVSKRYTKILPAYDNIVVISEKALQDAKNIFPHCVEKFTLIYNQFDYNKIISMADNEVFDPLLTEDFVLSAGRLVESQKDFTTLITAYNKVLQSTKTKLFIIGDGPDRPLLQKQIDTYGIGEQVILLGKKDNPFVWMKYAKAFILSSKHEGLPSVLIEALALDCPLISTNCPDGPDEILLQGRAGVLVEVGNSEQMADAIIKVLTDDEYRIKLADTAKLHKDRFDIQQNINKLSELL